MPNPFLIPAATIFAAFVAAVVALISLTVAKEGKISEFRQAWVDALREDLTQFLCSARVMARSAIEKRALSDNPNHHNKDIFFSSTITLEYRPKVAEYYQRILLRLNSKQVDHKELLKCLSETIDKMNLILEDDSADMGQAIDSIDIASDSAAIVLKREWEAVKAGEPNFRMISKASKWFLIVLAFAISIPIILLVIDFCFNLSSVAYFLDHFKLYFVRIFNFN